MSFPPRVWPFQHQMSDSNFCFLRTVWPRISCPLGDGGPSPKGSLDAWGWVLRVGLGPREEKDSLSPDGQSWQGWQNSDAWHLPREKLCAAVQPQCLMIHFFWTQWLITVGRFLQNITTIMYRREPSEHLSLCSSGIRMQKVSGLGAACTCL